MPPKSLFKVQKQVTRKKGKNATALHPHSRDRKRIARAEQRADRLGKLQEKFSASYQPYLLRLAFMQESLQTRETILSVDEMKSLAEEYIANIEKELQDLESERRPGRPPHPRRDKLAQKINAERNEFGSGYWMPDLRDEKMIYQLQHWNQEWSSLGQMKWCRVATDGTVKNSTFPPKGNS